jgi:hypothetical protein
VTSALKRKKELKGKRPLDSFSSGFLLWKNKSRKYMRKTSGSKGLRTKGLIFVEKTRGLRFDEKPEGQRTDSEKGRNSYT